MYSIARGVLQAATSDNVQPLAIIACEQFGNTLAISQETRRKIEATVLPTPEPITLQYLKVKIGFMKHDCVVQLGSNQAGLRFLALAAALTSTTDEYACAEILLLMLEATTTDHTLVPTRRQLRDLLSSIRGRCQLARFPDVVYGYGFMIKGLRNTQAGFNPRHFERTGDYLCLPGPREVAALVDAFRSLQRIGDDTISSIEVQVFRNTAAWVAAFSKWCLETPPSLLFSDGTPIVTQPGSTVKIIIVDSDVPLRCIKFFYLNSHRDLILEETACELTGSLVGLETYCRVLRERYCYGADNNTLLAALPLAITIFHSRLLAVPEPDFLDQSKKGRPNSNDRSRDNPAPYLTMFNSSPSLYVLQRTMSLVLGLPLESATAELSPVASFMDIPEVANLLQNMHCSRLPCFEPRRPVLVANRWDTSGAYKVECDECGFDQHHRPAWENLVERLSELCLIIYLISTIEKNDDIMLDPDFLYLDDSRLTTAIWDCLVSSQNDEDMRVKFVHSAFSSACYLLGISGTGPYASSDSPSAPYHSIIYSNGTYTVWSTALDARILSEGIQSRIICRKGVIIHRNDRYNKVVALAAFGKNRWPMLPPTKNLFPFWKEQWHVSPAPEVDDTLIMKMTIISQELAEKTWDAILSTNAVEVLRRWLVLVDCRHRFESRIDQSSPKWRFMIPDAALAPVERKHGVLDILVAGIDREMQIFCLSAIVARRIRQSNPKISLGYVVVRRRGCFDCCIKACEVTGASELVL